MDDGSNIVLMSLKQDLVLTRAKVAAVAEMMKTDAQGRAATDADDRITWSSFELVSSHQASLALRLMA